MDSLASTRRLSSSSLDDEFYLPKPLMMLISSYMANYDLSKLSQCNSYFLSCVQAHYKILYNQLIHNEFMGNAPGNSFPELEENYMILYAQLLTRKTFQVSSYIKLNPHEPDVTKDTIATKFESAFGRQILQIQQGGKLTGCLGYNGDFMISLIQEVDEAFTQQRDRSLTIQVQQKVSYFSVGAQDLAYIDEYGFVFSVVYDNESIHDPIVIQIGEKAKLVSVGQTHSLAVTESNRIHSWPQAFYVPEDKPSQVQGLDGKQIIDIKSTVNQSIVLTSDQLVYVIDHQTKQDIPMKAKQIKKLKNIVQIASNCSHFMALEREDKQAIEHWTHQQVEQWFKDINLGDCANLIKYKQINGATILKANEEFLEDILGMTQLVEQQKFRFELNKAKDGQIGETILYGWGNNSFGQLGLFGTNNYPDPKQIPLPQFADKNDYIINIECGKRNSAIMTKQGEIWITGNYKPEKITKAQIVNNHINKEKDSIDYVKPQFNAKRKKSTVVESDDQYQLQGHSENYRSEFELKTLQSQVNYKTQKQRMRKQKNHINKYVQELKEYREEHKKENEREQNLKHRFICFNNVFSQQAFGKNYSVISIALCNKTFVAICCYKFHKGPKIVNKHKAGMKFKGGDQVIKKLLYQAKTNPNTKYSVCYEDRFMGLVEDDVERFYYGSDIPLHRIQMFKQDGVTIWDRKNKFSAI